MTRFCSFLLLIELVLIAGCSQDALTPTQVEADPVIPAFVIALPDTASAVVNGVFFFHNQPFSGQTEERFDSLHSHVITRYWKGLQEGYTEVFFPDGGKESLRYYHNGEKDSLHTGWWPGGSRRFEYRFANGVYEGSFAEWYSSGQPAKLLHYHAGVETDGKGWRENGKIFMNYEVRNGRRFGLVNDQLCFSLKSEQKL